MPFVSCVSQIAPGQYAALFGYENPLNRVENVPLGTQNSLTPAATAASNQPLSVFQPGRVERGFWSLMNSPTLTWNVRSFSATASPSSPGCDRNAYPTASGRPAPGERPSPPVARDGKLIPYFVDPSHDATVPAALMKTTAASGSALQKLGAQQQALPSGFKPKFQVRLTNLTTGQDGCFASRTVDAEVLIDGTSLGRRRVYTDGCVFCLDSCPYGEPVTLNELFEAEMPEDRASVSVQIKLHEIDDVGDSEVVRDVSFTVDNLTGQPNRPTNCEGGQWGICWDVKATGLPTAVPATKICPKWNTDYVDESWGEDVLGARSNITEAARYPASFAAYSLEVSSPLGTISQSGFLDASGCVALDGATAKSLVFRTEGGSDTTNGGLGLTLLLSTDLERPDGVRYELRSFRGNPAADTKTPDVFRFSSQNPGDVPLTSWTLNNIWSIAPAEIELRLAPVGGRQVLSPMMNVGAVLSRLLVVPDTGIVARTYPVVQGRGCVFNGQVNSCVSNDTLLVGGPNFPPTPPSCTTDSQCASVQQCLETNFAPCPAGSTTCRCSWPDQARWKFVSAHEAGHQIQDPAMGGFNTTDYTFDCPANTTCTGVKSGSASLANELVDPPFVDQAGFCGCQHVGAANAEHGLQSVERSGAAQGEGFAQFFASKVFNNQSDADCTFVYYKEFFDTTCRANDPADCSPITAGAVTGINTLPPFGISCRNKIKWRNRHCPIGQAAEMGTELDWMVFLWNLNTVGSTLSPMTDVWKIYRHACNPPAPGQPPSNNPAACSGNEELSWSARGAVELTPARTCAFNQPNDCQRGERCRNAVMGSDAQCTSDTLSCVCKLPAVGGILDGARRAYVNDADRRQNVVIVGDSSGVSRDLSP